MKCMKKSDLILVLNDTPGDKVLDIRDVMSIFDAFGDDWFIEGNKFQKFSDNEAMAAMRKAHELL